MKNIILQYEFHGKMQRLPLSEEETWTLEELKVLFDLPNHAAAVRVGLKIFLEQHPEWMIGESAQN